jgi:hypothetical protein
MPPDASDTVIAFGNILENSKKPFVDPYKRN